MYNCPEIPMVIILEFWWLIIIWAAINQLRSGSYPPREGNQGLRQVGCEKYGCSARFV